MNPFLAIAAILILAAIIVLVAYFGFVYSPTPTPIPKPPATGAPAVRLLITAPNTESSNMKVTVTDDAPDQTLAVTAIDAKGNPTTLETGEPPLTWSVQGTNPEAVAITPSADGLSCVVHFTGSLTPGAGTAQVKADRAADPAKGLAEITGLLDYEVVAGKAVNLQLTPQ